MCGEADHHEAQVLLVAPRYLLQDLQALGFPQQEITEIVCIRVYKVPLCVVELVWHLVLLGYQKDFSEIRDRISTSKSLLRHFFCVVRHRDVLGDVAIQDVLREEAELCRFPVDLIEEDLTL